MPVPGQPKLTRSSMTDELRRNLSQSKLRDVLEDEGVDSLQQLTLSSLRSLYEEYVCDPDEDYLSTTYRPKTKTQKGPEKMKRLIASTVRNAKNRTVEISIEDQDGKFLTPDNKKVEREIGEDVPVYLTMPQEVYDAIMKDEY